MDFDPERRKAAEQPSRFRSVTPEVLEWVKTRVLRPGALDGMNDEGRAVVLTIIETGARPSEICNLTEQVIKLDASVPHILIEPRLAPDDPREIKTTTSVRTVPLIGLALAAMTKFPTACPLRLTSSSGKTICSQLPNTKSIRSAIPSRTA